MKKRDLIAAFAFCALLLSCSRGAQTKVNLSHLDALCQDIVLAGIPCTIVHIYADAPDYHWTDAAEEGIACVDDVARAAIVYMKAFESGYRVDLQRIKGLLNFVLVLQAEDGEFYNFIQSDLSINKTAVTSRKDFAFWAARGYWALGAGAAFFQHKDHAYADTLKEAFLKCLLPLDSLMSRYGEFVEINGKQYPDWLMIRNAGDATSELLLGVTAYLRIEKNPLLESYARKLAEGIVAMQIQDHPLLSGAFESWPGLWHGWGNSQVQALIELAEILSDKNIEKAAAFSADRFLSRLAAGRLISGFDFAGNTIQIYPQIAYDVRPTALGLLALYRTTKEPRYAVMAGLAASWFYGSNVADFSMYDHNTGRIYDGIDQIGVNRNSGAESTIEGLYTLLEIEAEPQAAGWLKAQAIGIVHSFFTDDALGAVNTFFNQTDHIETRWNEPSRTVEITTPEK